MSGWLTPSAPRGGDDQDLDAVADLVAALAEHVVDLERRIAAIEDGTPAPKRIAASDLRRIAKALMALSLRRRHRRRRAADDDREGLAASVTTAGGADEQRS